MSNQTGRSIRAQLMWLSLIIVTVSVALSLAGTLYITLRTERKTLDQNLLNSASILSQVPLVREALLGEVPADELADFLDAATARTSDIDLILVGDTESVLRYAPDRSFIGSRYTGSAQTSALAGAEPYTFDDSGPMGSDHSAYAPIRDESGAVIGFMAVGLYLRSLTHVALTTALRLAAIGALAAAVGALLALRACGMEFSVIALIGVLLLCGIVKKNAIMMIDFAIEAARTRNLPPREAIHEACRLRFRPIMMTTAAAILGAVPLALGQGDGAEIRQPLGITIVGGLLVSQLLTLYTTPVVYLCLDRARLRWRRRWWRLRYGERKAALLTALCRQG